MEKQENQEKKEISPLDKVFIAELIQDIPLWLSIVMGIYKELQNEYVYYFSLVIGTIASIYIIQKIKEGVYSPGAIAQNPNEAFVFTIYTFAILIVLIIGSWKEILYMENYTWTYLIVFSAIELIFYLKQQNKQE
jgi:hypothetical protein